MKQRPIKFRAYDKHYECYIPTDLWAVVTTDFRAFGIMLKDWNSYRECEYFYENAQILEQFTGLYDRNGKEIYEGDIVKVIDHPTNIHTGIGEVWYNEGSFVVQGDFISSTSLSFYGSSWIEVIGNIHEK